MFLFEVIDPFVKLCHWEWLSEINFGTIAIRLILSVLCGGAIGLDRAIKHHAAGFRTYIIVCLGSTIAMLTNEFLTRATDAADGARLGAQVISGIGFLGAGTIMFTSRNQVRGLTTAAGLWACACLGLSIGIGFYTLSVMAAIVIVVVMAILPRIEKALTVRSRQFTLHVELYSRENLKELISLIRGMDIKILSVEHNPAYSQSGLSVYTIELKNLKKKRINHMEFMEELRQNSYIHFIEEML